MRTLSLFRCHLLLLPNCQRSLFLRVIPREKQPTKISWIRASTAGADSIDSSQLRESSYWLLSGSQPSEKWFRKTFPNFLKLVLPQTLLRQTLAANQSVNFKWRSGILTSQKPLVNPVGKVFPKVSWKAWRPDFKPLKGSSLDANQKTNGDDRDRTGNLRLARAALSQLSYVPQKCQQQILLLTNLSYAIKNCKTTKVPLKVKKWAYVDSNHGPQLYQSCALTNWAIRPNKRTGILSSYVVAVKSLSTLVLQKITFSSPQNDTGSLIRFAIDKNLFAETFSNRLSH